ncbi:MAG: S-layer protein [Candidatus Marsarchaeota archaeon]|nr:S-layer protein [Candidatus Marsarchaeota archaeon]
MKSINTKRIAAAVAASLLMGLAFAGSGGVTWSNIPIINNQGQPVVQVVVGSAASPSDGVVAANIAAVLGNLAFTSQNVTATPTGLSNVNCVVTTPSCTLSNQQVWFNEKGFSGPHGSYAFTALIGSVLNAGVTLGSPINTKNPVANSGYAFPEYSGSSEVPTQSSPAVSPFSTLSSPPSPQQTVSAANGGGLAYSTVRDTGYDNLLQITSSQLPSLLSNYGTAGESETLWVSGFPVYDQKSGTNPTTPSLAVFDVGGAYQATFSNKLAAIQLLGKNWTILNYTLPGGGSLKTALPVDANKALVGGELSLASSLTSLQTVYVGHNITNGPWSVQVTDLGQPNSAGQSQAAVQVYYNGTLTNVTQLAPGYTTKFSVGKASVFVNVNQTFAGLYAYQKWAKMKLYSNVVNFTSGSVFNQTNANGWRGLIFWSNSSGAGLTNQLQSIVVYNVTPTVLTPGDSFALVGPNYTAYDVNFVGDTLGSNYDPVSFSTSAIGGGTTFKNYGTQPPAGEGALTYISEPYQTLTATSQIPSAFSYSGQTGSSFTYDLTPYTLSAPTANTVGLFPFAGTPNAGSGMPVNLIVASTLGDANIITANNYLTVTLQGYTSNTAVSPSTATVYVKSMGTPAFQPGYNVINPGSPSGSSIWSGVTSFYNITNVTLSTALPDLNVYVLASNSVGPAISVTGGVLGASSSANTLATLSTASPELMYKTSGTSYYQLATSAVTYNQQNGQPFPTGGFSIASATAPPMTMQMNPYFTFNVLEYNVPGSTSSNDVLQFGIYNSTSGAGSAFGFALNRTVGQSRNNLTYYSSQVQSGVGSGSAVAAPVGFVTERGSSVAQISPSKLTLNLAKAVDTLQFYVKPVSASGNATSTTEVGPVSINQAVPGFANLTVAKVNATCSGGSSTTSACTVTGLANVTATPSVAHAVVPVSLNTATTPLVVLDSNANSAATLVVVGSKYVNSVAAQIFAQNPSLNSTFGPSSVVVQAYGTNRVLVAGYTANQTVQAGNQFINDLLQAASTT